MKKIIFFLLFAISCSAEEPKKVEYSPTRGFNNAGRLRDSFGFVAPAGAISMFGGSTAPDGWLICDGSAVSRTNYDNLFAVIGTTYGVGDGSTTFNLPDLRGRAPIGSGTGTGLTNRTLGGTVGTETHTLSISEMPSHSHTGASRTDVNTTGGGGENMPNTSGGGTWTSNANGSGSAHNIMQPSLVLNFIIKI